MEPAASVNHDGHFPLSMSAIEDLCSVRHSYVQTTTATTTSKMRSPGAARKHTTTDAAPVPPSGSMSIFVSDLRWTLRCARACCASRALAACDDPCARHTCSSICRRIRRCRVASAARAKLETSYTRWKCSYGYHGLYVQSSGTSWASGFGIS